MRSKHNHIILSLIILAFAVFAHATMFPPSIQAQVVPASIGIESKLQPKYNPNDSVILRRVAGVSLKTTAFVNAPESAIDKTKIGIGKIQNIFYDDAKDQVWYKVEFFSIPGDIQTLSQWPLINQLLGSVILALNAPSTKAYSLGTAWVLQEHIALSDGRLISDVYKNSLKLYQRGSGYSVGQYLTVKAGDALIRDTALYILSTDRNGGITAFSTYGDALQEFSTFKKNSNNTSPLTLTQSTLTSPPPVPPQSNAPLVDGCAVDVVGVDHPYTSPDHSLYVIAINIKYIGKDCASTDVLLSTPYARANAIATTPAQIALFGGYYDLDKALFPPIPIPSSLNTIQQASIVISNALQPRMAIETEGLIKPNQTITVGNSNWTLIRGIEADRLPACDPLFRDCTPPDPLPPNYDDRNDCDKYYGGDCAKKAREEMAQATWCYTYGADKKGITCALDLENSSSGEMTAEVEHSLGYRLLKETLAMTLDVPPDLPDDTTMTSVVSTPTLIHGSCSTTLNSCTSGTFSDQADTTTNSLWQCLGSNGGSTASCSLPIAPTPPDSNAVTVLPWVGPSIVTAGSSNNSYTLIWNGGPMKQSWSTFAHFVKSDNTATFGTGFWPTPATTEWKRGTVTSTTGTFSVPVGQSPGPYDVMVGLYSGGTRVTSLVPATDQGVSADEQYRYKVGRITVKAAPTPIVPSSADTLTSSIWEAIKSFFGLE